MSLIPWGDVGGVGPGEDSCELACKALSKLKHVFETDANQQLAYKTIVSEVLRCRLAWHDGHSDVGDPSVPVPDWWSTFVTDAVRSILVNGNFVFRRLCVRAGVPMYVVADPALVYTRWCKKTNTYAASCCKHRWKVGLVEPPDRVTPRGEADVLATMKSAAIRASDATEQLAALVKNFVQRDRLNSENTVYTSVSDQLKQQNGSDRQWFRNVTSGDALPSRAPDIDSNFHTLMHRRAQTIEGLDAITNIARARNAGHGGGFGNVGDTSQGSPPPLAHHSEHVVSDGRSYTEARQLGSLPDSKLLFDELKHSILFSFGVPPQALGRNINSERIASSNRLTEMAITTYTSFISLLRDRIGEAIRFGTETPSGSFVAFSVCLAQYELDRLRPYMKDTVCMTMTARCYQIPESFLDMNKMRAADAVTPGGVALGTKRKRSATAEASTDETIRRRRDAAAKPAE